MSESRNFYVMEIISNKDVYDLKWDITEVRDKLNSNHIYVVCHFDSLNIFIWIGKNIKKPDQIEFARLYSETIKNHAKENTDQIIEIHEEFESHENSHFKNLFNLNSSYKDQKLISTIQTNQNQQIDISHIISPISEKKLHDLFEKFENMSLKEQFSHKKEIVLPEGVKFQEYVTYCDENSPFGKDKSNKSFLFPQPSEVAHRMDLKNQEDWGSLRKSGLGWKLNPTIFIALLCFVPCLIIYPVLYAIFGRPDLILASIKSESFSNLPFLLITGIIVKLIGYCFNNFDGLLKPYGKDSQSFQILWKNELEYLKFESDFFEKTYHKKWVYLGLIGFISMIIFSFSYFFLRPGAFEPIENAIPQWTKWFVLFNNIGIALLVFLVVTFLIAVMKGLFIIGNLGEDRSKLSIEGYKQMIEKINYKLKLAQGEKGSIIDSEFEYRFNGRTFYEFQRGNRKIGELLFNIAGYLILLCITTGVTIFIFKTFNLLPADLIEESELLAYATTLMGILSFGVFIAPQISLHHFLKEFKYSLIDKFAEMKSRFEFLYYECLMHPTVLHSINNTWENIDDLQENINLTSNMIEEIKKYGTWSYDFPEVIKVFAVAIATFIPIILDLASSL